MYEAILYVAVAYILLCKLTYGYHNQARFYQKNSKTAKKKKQKYKNTKIQKYKNTKIQNRAARPVL